MSREYTTRLLEMIEEGLLSADNVLNSCLSYMPEADVKDMAEREGFIEDEEESEEEEEDEPWDGFASDSEADADALASAGYGTDEDYGGYEDDVPY